MPMPPAFLLMMAHCFSVSNMPSMLSSLMASRKQLDNWGLLVPALKSVGVA
ncbi:hypothetical protein BpHYR1_043490 [Brachionus plicatilis]|uniref:Uncharacterized protein n=1 Tax=Brachionus plicatilis TaxID=10195 RepID=A0A3M7P674_BRAPC|nr:hypothetical protein BpHYR1_043490 [Brachionus plicatilis]